MATHVSIRGLGGEKEVALDDEVTVGDLRRLGHISEGLTVRFNGSAVGDDHVAEDEDVYVTTPPAAKHGLAA